MNRHCFLWAAVYVCGFAAAAQAQVSLKHNPKYKEGQKYKVSVEMNLEQTLTLNGMDLDSNVEQFLIMVNTVGKQGDDGTIPVNSEFEVLQTNMTLPGGLQLAFDSGDPDKQSDNAQLEAIMSLLRASSKAKWQTVVGKDHKIESVKYTNDVFDSLDERLRKEVDPEKYKRQGNQDIDRLPTDPVKKGETWKRTEQVEFGGGQTFKFAKEYTYLGTVKMDGATMDRISAKYLTVTYSTEDDSMIQVLESKLKPSSSEESLLYDRKLGVVTKSTSKLAVVGDLKIVIAGQEFDGKLDLKMKADTKVEH